MNQQKTLRSPLALTGVGLHTGNEIRVRILPADPDTGLRFRRVDADPVVEIPAASRWVVDTSLATVLGRDGVQLSTVEHCLAALGGLGIDNAVVEVDGPELPILDGSALPYVEALLEAGWRRQKRPRRALRVDKPVRVEQGDKFCIVRPAADFRVTYSIDFDGRFPGVHHYFLSVDPATFAAELSPARTFGFLADVEYLRSMGKARGGSLDNAVVLHEGQVLNPEGLRMPDELVRHKMLDAVGDLALLGRPILGHLIVHRGGHALHDALVKALLARPDAWTVVPLDEPAVRGARAPLPRCPLVPAHA